MICRTGTTLPTAATLLKHELPAGICDGREEERDRKEATIQVKNNYPGLTHDTNMNGGRKLHSSRNEYSLVKEKARENATCQMA